MLTGYVVVTSKLSTLVDEKKFCLMSAGMTTAPTTQEKLHAAARRLFWERGYSNVSVRKVASAAGVDIALISRYFGSKQGLFQATLDQMTEVEAIRGLTPRELVEAIVDLCRHTPRQTPEPSSLRMLLTNAHDTDVGDMVRECYRRNFNDPIAEILGSQERAAMFSAVLLGMSVAEKSLRLPGIGAPEGPLYEAQIRQLFSVATEFAPDETKTATLP